MPRFLCQVGEKGGELRSIRIEAESAEAARHELASRNLDVFAVRRLGRFAAGTRNPDLFRLRRRVRDREVLLFNQELAALLRAGLPLAEALSIMVERMDNPTFREAVERILGEVRSGTAMSEAVRHHRFFPGVYAACLKAGETSGDLPGMIERFTGAMRVAVGARANFTAALVYPAFLLLALVGAAAYLLLGVVPNFFPFFAGFEQELPALTLGLLGVADFFRNHAGWVAVGIAASGLGFLVWSRSERSKRIRDRLLLALPVVGEVQRLYGVSQFGRALGALLGGGMPLARAIPVASGAISNRHLRAAVEPTSGEVSEGQPFVGALARTGEIPGFALRMVQVGENTGDLGRMVTSIADFGDEVVENRVSVLLSLLTPVALLILGGLVALVLLAIYLPLFSLAAVPDF